MNRDAAVHLISQTFDSPFDDGRFERLAGNLLNTVDRSRAFTSRHGAYIPKPFQGHVRQYKRPFVYADPNGERLDVLIVRLHSESSLDRARTMQRNFIAWYLKQDHDEPVDAALVAFYHDDAPDWRFSLVRLEYAFGDEGLEEKLTPARRYSFLVGPTEPTHTAEQQLLPFLLTDGSNPTIDQLAAAFQVETVSKQFFEAYKELFLRLVEAVERSLQSDALIAEDFQRSEISVPNFAKKLLGQIVFLYFVQKKGWLGLDTDQSWGAGPKDFLRGLFSGRQGLAYSNFFDEILEPLFYDALAKKRPGDLFTLGGCTCKIPFLNGGLFEPMGGYDWEGTHLRLPNSLFSNRDNDRDDSGTGILDVFDRYNFTVREEEPLEKEVAVDPEMLGKVFENLLEIQDRKSKGAFYTPREIVHYMCQESLISYLDTAINRVEVSIGSRPVTQGVLFGEPLPVQQALTNWERQEQIPIADITKLVRWGALAYQQDAAKEDGLQKGDYVMPTSIRVLAADLDQSLSTIKICDPAIGSGAFPVGMLHEIVQARRVLATYLDGVKDTSSRSIYALKRHAIQESIYGVDIDSGAVEIAKLRLWLSLVVDEESYDSIQPLPNLDYKVVQGDTLLGYPYSHQGLGKIESLKKKFFGETDPDSKDVLRQKIEQAIQSIYSKSKTALGYQVTFDFKIDFSEVFAQQGGFDVVIGNPPYLRIQGIRKQNPGMPKHYKQLFGAATGSYDLYGLFTEKGLSALSRIGILNFIMPEKWVNAAFGRGLRQVVVAGCHLKKLISFGTYQVFNASTYTSLIWLTNTSNQYLAYYEFERELPDNRSLELALNKLKWDDFNHLDCARLSSDVWVLTNKAISEILDKVDRQPKRLGAIFPKIFQGIATSKDSVYFLTNCEVNGNLVDGFSKELGERVVVERDLLRPLLKGDQVHRYEKLLTSTYAVFPYTRKNRRNDVEIILLPSKEIRRRFPLGWQYLERCKDVLKQRESGRFNHQQWYQFSRHQGMSYGGIEKLLSPDISLGGNFAYDPEGYYYSTTTVYGYIKSDSVQESYKFWLSIMNSKLLWFYLQNTGTVLANGYFRYKPDYLRNFPVPDLKDISWQKPFETLVDYIIFLRSQEFFQAKGSKHAQDRLMITYFEQILDAMVYELYFEPELHKTDNQFIQPMLGEEIPTLDQISGKKLHTIRAVFQKLFDQNHTVRRNLFYLDTIELIRIIEGKQK